MAFASSGNVPPLVVFVACIALACGDIDHPPPVGGGGRGPQTPPVLDEFGGAKSSAGTNGEGGPSMVTGGMTSVFAGNSAFSGDTSNGGTSSASAGDAAIGGNGSAEVLSNFSGSFSSGGS